jgi:phosphoribosylformylglycinamidine synthase subunit PurSL
MMLHDTSDPLDADVIGRLFPDVVHNVEWPSGHIIDVALHPGVTDRVATEIERAARLLGRRIRVATGWRFELDGVDDLERIAVTVLSNPIIERWATAPIAPSWPDHEVGAVAAVETVAIRGMSADELATVNRGRGLALDDAELKVIVEWFTEQGRDPTDVEIETLAQTWSEHCSHKTFRARISTADGELVPLLKQLRNATDIIAAPWVHSAFVGNAGIVEVADGVVLALKMETHNHPSAVEPFGGANTGVGGVLRDVMAAPARPIATTDVLCFGPIDATDAPAGTLPPRVIADGVVAGVADYGNKFGVATVAGSIVHHEGYTANPLVFCGAIGLVPPHAPLTGPHPGDRVVVLGGRTGRDGIRGATFSSLGMDATTGEVAGASVQIGDPIVQKLVADALDELVDHYSAITDCGAGGFASAIGELADGVGADIDLRFAPTKYAGLAPWEVWLSEAQERMVLAVAPDRIDAVGDVCARHGVEWADLGSFGSATADARLVVRSHGAVVLDLPTGFLHDGRPQRQLDAVMPAPNRDTVVERFVDDARAVLLALLAHPTIASKRGVVRQYDHEIGGATVVRPYTGPNADGPSDGVVIADPAASNGFVIGIGMNPWWGALDPERMAIAAVDEAIRNVVVAGADPERIALLDNFSWGSPRDPATLGGLAAAVRGCVTASLAYGTPFVSGKDSLNNTYLDADGVRRDVPPTLVITAVGGLPDADAFMSIEPRAGDVLLAVGGACREFGGSHLDLVLGNRYVDAVPDTPLGALVPRYRALHQAIRRGLIAAAHDISEGGLAVAICEMALAGDVGVTVQVDALAGSSVEAMFSEAPGRVLLAVGPERVAEVVSLFDNGDLVMLGEFDAGGLVRFATASPFAVSVDEVRTAFNSGAWA